MRDRAAKAAYQREYQQRPEVKARNAARQRAANLGGPGRDWRKGATLPPDVKRDRRKATLARHWVAKGRAARAAWVAVHGWPYVPAAPVEPMPMAYVGHPVFEEATRAAGLTGASYSVDWGQYDILGEAVLAILEGRDPKQAVSKQRAAMRGIERSTTRSYADLGRDDEGNIYAVKDYDGD